MVNRGPELPHSPPPHPQPDLPTKGFYHATSGQSPHWVPFPPGPSTRKPLLSQSSLSPGYLPQTPLALTGWPLTRVLPRSSHLLRPSILEPLLSSGHLLTRHPSLDPPFSRVTSSLLGLFSIVLLVTKTGAGKDLETNISKFHSTDRKIEEGSPTCPWLSCF